MPQVPGPAGRGSELWWTDGSSPPADISGHVALIARHRLFVDGLAGRGRLVTETPHSDPNRRGAGVSIYWRPCSKSRVRRSLTRT
jgi:hypothetical protein